MYSTLSGDFLKLIMPTFRVTSCGKVLVFNRPRGTDVAGTGVFGIGCRFSSKQSPSFVTHTHSGTGVAAGVADVAVGTGVDVAAGTDVDVAVGTGVGVCGT